MFNGLFIPLVRPGGVTVLLLWAATRVHFSVSDILTLRDQECLVDWESGSHISPQFDYVDTIPGFINEDVCGGVSLF